MGKGLYIHIPFCAKKCPYCDFYTTGYKNETVDLYMKAVARNLRNYSEICNDEIDSIYFGGGTPSLVPPLKFVELFEELKKGYNLNNPEITLEANPSLVNKEKLTEFHALGFNRISFGVQSFNDSELKELGRVHNKGTALRAIENAYSAGFKNISVDLMIGLIGQTEESLSYSFEAIKNLPLNHISAYMLIIEEGTKYASEEIRKKLPDDDKVSDLYLYTINELKKMGFYQYEISNFAQKGYSSIHNLHYWRCEEYIGIGPSAHSYYNGRRYKVPSDIFSFIEDNKQREVIIDNNPGSFEEYGMLKIRLNEGVNLDYCQNKYNIDSQKIYKKIERLCVAGLITVNNSTVSLTPKGCLVSNLIIEELFVE